MLRIRIFVSQADLDVIQLDLLRTLILWALTSSDVISTIMKDRYKQNRHADDENQPLSVQPWGNDGDKRRYFLIQGLDDTGFRVYREGNRYTKNAHWWSVAGNIQEVKDLAEKLEKQDGTQAARRLAMKMSNAIPMFEATEEVKYRVPIGVVVRIFTDSEAETASPRVQAATTSSFRTSRAGLRYLRRSYPWKTYALHLR
jgi:hypothetical protein